MPDLNIVSCPSCGLPAELIAIDSATTGVPERFEIHCLDSHVSSVDLWQPDADPTTEGDVILVSDEDLIAADVEAVFQAGPDPREHSRLASRNVVAFPTPEEPTLRRRLATLLRGRAWYFASIAYGALAVLLLLKAPLAALVLIPISIPVTAIVMKHRTWRPLFVERLPAQLDLDALDGAQLGDAESGSDSEAGTAAA